jgi:hypothetical protein
MAKEIIKFTFSKASSLAFEPDILAPQQYIKNYRRTNPAEPEKALMFAVLAEAVDTYQRFAFSESCRGQALFREAEAWFWGEESDSLFSFLSICEVFGLDPAFLRRGLMQWTANRERDRSPRKKFQLHLERGRARKPLCNVGNKSASNHRGKEQPPRWRWSHLVSPRLSSG